MGDKERKWRLERLLIKQKLKQPTQYGALFNECVDALGEGTVILSEEKSEETYDFLQKSYPFSPWSRINWEIVNSKIVIEHVNEIIPLLTKMLEEFDDYVFILWSYGNYPVLQSQLEKAIDSIDDVLAVSSDTFIFSPSRFVIEFHHEGEITVGFENQNLD